VLCVCVRQVVCAMAIYDSERNGYRIFVGDLGPRVEKFELQQEFERFGPITDVWVAKCVERTIYSSYYMSSTTVVIGCW